MGGKTGHKLSHRFGHCILQMPDSREHREVFQLFQYRRSHSPEDQKETSRRARGKMASKVSKAGIIAPPAILEKGPPDLPVMEQAPRGL